MYIFFFFLYSIKYKLNTINYKNLILHLIYMENNIIRNELNTYQDYFVCNQTCISCNRFILEIEHQEQREDNTIHYLIFSNHSICLDCLTHLENTTKWINNKCLICSKMISFTLYIRVNKTKSIEEQKIENENKEYEYIHFKEKELLLEEYIDHKQLQKERQEYIQQIKELMNKQKIENMK